MAPAALELVVHEASGDPVLSLVLLHGHGDDPAALVERAAARAPSDVRLIAPVGPVRTMAGEPAWFASMPGDEPAHGDDGSLATAVDRLAGTFATPSHGGGPEALFGYSQGAATALALSFSSDTGSSDPGAERWRPRALTAVASWLPSDPELGWDFAAGAGRTRVALLHGTDDEVVDLQMGRAAARVLERSGVDVTFAEIAGDHALSDDAIGRAISSLTAEF